MTRYFFDVRNGDALHRDFDGIELPDIRSVWQIALTMVDEVVEAGRPPRTSESVSVIVRDTSDAVVYRSDHLGRVAVPEASGHASDRRTPAGAG
ncbi:hypothetical protein [Jatrophihabitans endophyticus]|uniref:DUF6894 family protein n=1 Tax=Jatrophihabitans endophyticus TaxID=1206085 RepID=UPI001A076CEC|nr:hypothetical protein [Jatrophihabitans endophyticus]MBE7190303.1 hypothetical protein [Jatrophihabitans endophyticus]